MKLTPFGIVSTKFRTFLKPSIHLCHLYNNLKSFKMGALNRAPDWENYVSISFHIELDMIVVTVFLSILNQMKFHLVHKIERKTVTTIISHSIWKEIGNIVFSVFSDRPCQKSRQVRCCILEFQAALICILLFCNNMPRKYPNYFAYILHIFIEVFYWQTIWVFYWKLFEYFTGKLFKYFTGKLLKYFFWVEFTFFNLIYSLGIKKKYE